jgi:hypothetical protein
MFNFGVDLQQLCLIGNKNYPVTIAGNGIPSLSIGLGTIAQRSLSNHFKEYFKVYASDLYCLDSPIALHVQSWVKFRKLIKKKRRGWLFRRAIKIG